VWFGYVAWFGYAVCLICSGRSACCDGKSVGPKLNLALPEAAPRKKWSGRLLPQGAPAWLGTLGQIFLTVATSTDAPDQIRTPHS